MTKAAPPGIMQHPERFLPLGRQKIAPSSSPTKLSFNVLRDGSAYEQVKAATIIWNLSAAHTVWLPSPGSWPVDTLSDVNYAGFDFYVDNDGYDLTVANASGTTVAVVQSGHWARIHIMPGTTTYVVTQGTGALTNKTARVTITNAEMLALRATPKELVAAPGAGYLLRFLGATLYFNYTAAYTETTDNMAVKYENGSGTQVSEDIEATGFVDATADTVTIAQAKHGALIAKTGCVNKALVLHNTGDGEYGGGNAANTMIVDITYQVVASPF